MVMSRAQRNAAWLVLWGDGVEPLGPPRNLRYTHSAFGITFRWDEPASWGRDDNGTGERQYETDVREIDDNGRVESGFDWDDPPAQATTPNRDATYSTIQRGEHLEIRVRAVNRLGQRSEWAYEIGPEAGPLSGALRMDSRFLRIDGARLRLV